MVVVLPRASLIRLREHGITHFLRIPFTTAKSTPQLLRSIERVAQDPIASALPRLAWNSPDEVHFATGLLSLKTPSCKKTATRLLNDVTRTYSANSFGLSARPTPAISLQGLATAQDPSKRTGFLLCEIRESWPFLEDFCSQVQRAFTSNGFLPALSSQHHAVLRTMIMKLTWFPTDVVNQKTTLRGKGYVLTPKFDASDLVQNTKTLNGLQNFLWRDCAFQNLA
ncbi:hypothetical protein XPA_005519 [Xanthoria parietina]